MDRVGGTQPLPSPCPFPEGPHCPLPGGWPYSPPCNPLSPTCAAPQPPVPYLRVPRPLSGGGPTVSPSTRGCPPIPYPGVSPIPYPGVALGPLVLFQHSSAVLIPLPGGGGWVSHVPSWGVPCPLP